MRLQIYLLDLHPQSCRTTTCTGLRGRIVDHYGEQRACVQASTAPRAFLGASNPDLILLRPAPGLGFAQMIGDLKSRHETSPILGLLCDWRNEYDDLARALGQGLDDFVTCPFAELDIFPRLERLIAPRQGARPTVSEGSAPPHRHFGSMVGESQAFLEAIGKVPLLAGSDATVLVQGETGTGKDMVARAIHYQSRRNGHPFIPVNCGGLPDHLFENELFGHAKGAFTDAATAERGLVAEAEGGTLFLDEVDAMSLAAQAKVLRFLQDLEYRPLGSARCVTADVRVIAATNKNLRQMVEAKSFREDLFYRLNVLTLSIPPLRERTEDILLLAESFLAKYAAKHGRGPVTLSQGAAEKLLAHAWPGNVRELDSVIQRALLLGASDPLMPQELDVPVALAGQIDPAVSLRQAKQRTMGQFERAFLINLLRSHRGNVTHAARAAGKERRSFQRLLQKYGLGSQAFRAPC